MNTWTFERKRCIGETLTPTQNLDCYRILRSFFHFWDGESAFYCANHRVSCRCQQPPGWKIHRFFRWKMPFAIFRSGSGVSECSVQPIIHSKARWASTYDANRCPVKVPCFGHLSCTRLQVVYLKSPWLSWNITFMAYAWCLNVGSWGVIFDNQPPASLARVFIGLWSGPSLKEPPTCKAAEDAPPTHPNNIAADLVGRAGSRGERERESLRTTSPFLSLAWQLFALYKHCS